MSRDGENERRADLHLIHRFFSLKNWKTFAFQEQTWRAYSSGQSGLIHIPTGFGKTLASFMGPLARLEREKKSGLQVLYISPLRALTRDIEKSLNEPVALLNLNIIIKSRTGDTSSYQRQKQKEKQPHILITTPESLAILLTDPLSSEQFANLHTIIIDEWHELLSSKRGAFLELFLARLRGISPQLQTWAMSATLANLELAAQAAVGLTVRPQIIQATDKKEIEIETLLPAGVSSIPWGGHLGLFSLKEVLQKVDIKKSALLFTHTRAQSERWYRALLSAKPEWKDKIALHHGSLDVKERERIEAGLKLGLINLVVCTSSLDLGVDFSPVDQVFQVGSPKSVSKVLQRAGRSGHQPGAKSKITLIPTHALEILEVEALIRALAAAQIEPKEPTVLPLDVLAQHLMTCAMGGGFARDTILEEIKNTYSYRSLKTADFDPVLLLLTQGGESLKHYPEYHRIRERGGIYRISKIKFARLHKLNIGTIPSESTLDLKFSRGERIGSIEESFASNLKAGDCFIFGGKALEFVKIWQNAVFAKTSTRKSALIPRWQGSRLPLSSVLSKHLREALDLSQQPILGIQRQVSHVPAVNEILLETFKSREGHHLFFYPFEGRLVHQGMAALFAHRLSQVHKTTFSMAVNDYGFELLTQDPHPFADLFEDQTITQENFLLEDIQISLNLTELAKRKFRDIARISALVFKNHAGSIKTSRQVQSSASLIYDVLKEYEPNHVLLRQAREEVLDQQFELERLRHFFQRMKVSKIKRSSLTAPSPFSFPLMMERISGILSHETLAERIYKMKAKWTQNAA